MDVLGTLVEEGHVEARSRAENKAGLTSTLLRTSTRPRKYWPSRCYRVGCAGEPRSPGTQLKSDLTWLVTIPSVSTPGFPEETKPALLEVQELNSGLLREVGVEDPGTLEALPPPSA